MEDGVVEDGNDESLDEDEVDAGVDLILAPEYTLYASGVLIENIQLFDGSK